MNFYIFFYNFKLVTSGFFFFLFLIAPIVGSEEQAKDLIAYIKSNNSGEESIWQTNIFGKSIGQLVEDGIHRKLIQISDESQVKLQDTMQKIVNDSKGGLVCIII